MNTKKRLLSTLIALGGTGAGLAYGQHYDFMEEVVVTGVQRAEMNARDAERNKDGFSSVISQDDAGNFADQNVAEALQRLPGVTLQKSEGEGRFITVRGLGPGFVAVSMNGSELASSSSDTRAFALDALPADLLGSIEVNKSLTPDMDLNSIGGSVNVNTVSAFDRKRDSLRVTAQGSYQEYSAELSPKLLLQGTNLFANDTIGVGYSLSWEKRYTEVYEMHHHSSELPRYLQQRLGGNNAPQPAPDAERILAPWSIETREEQAERTRTAGSLDLGWRPSDDHEYYLRISHTSFKDLDIALREYYRTDPGTQAEGEIAYVNADTRTHAVIDADLQHQFFIQEGTADTTAISLGGKNVFNNWTLDYNYAHSIGEFSKPDGSRVQFRIRDLPIQITSGASGYQAQVLSEAELNELIDPYTLNNTDLGKIAGLDSYLANSRVQGNMIYDNLFIEDSFREDTIDELALNLRRDFDAGFVNFVKTGIKLKQRERDRNKDRWSIDPRSSNDNGNPLYPADACGTTPECLTLRDATLGQFITHRPSNEAFQYDFITRAEAERLIAATYPIAKYTDPDMLGQESNKDDYWLTEDTAAAYVMAEFQLTPRASLIAGVRYEHTEFESSGYFAIRNDRFVQNAPADTTNYDIALSMDREKSSYGDFFPSLHYRLDLSDQVLVRASLWTSFTRPAFDQARSFAEIVGRVSLCNPDTPVCTDNLTSNAAGASQNPDGQIVTANGDLFYLDPDVSLRLGNPGLEAMTASHFDASISWYGNAGDFAQIAVFYKDIKDFIVDVRGANLALSALPVALPVDQVTQFDIPADTLFTNVNYAANGDKASVYGVELSYARYFDSDFFVQSNLTLMQSDAEVGDSIRAGSIRLPDQADVTANLTLGWENDSLSLRLIGNYRSRVLNRIGACSSDDIALDNANAVNGEVIPVNCASWADVYHNASLTLDFKAFYYITDDLRLNIDMINLTEQKDEQYFQGNRYSGGKMLFMSEDYGRSFQVGLNYRFM